MFRSHRQVSFRRLNIILKSFVGDFDRAVYMELLEVPPGEVISYSKLSKRTFGEDSKAARAVGAAMARNPFMIVVPCHRVVKSSGELGAYSGLGGTQTKKWLLEFERSSFHS